MKYKIDGEHQTGKYRLLIINDFDPELKVDHVYIDSIRYKTAVVYDLPNAVAIECGESVSSLIGKYVSV